MVSGFAHVVGVDASTIYAIFGAIGLLMLDWGLGILNSLKGHTFDIQKLPKQWATQVLSYVGGLAVTGILQPLTVGGLKTTLIALALAGAASISAKSLADIYVKLQTLVGSSPSKPTSVVPAPTAGLTTEVHDGPSAV